MNETCVGMIFFGGSLMADVRLWSRTDHKYAKIPLTIDTGASVTTISAEILDRLGYEPSKKERAMITTASGVEFVSQYMFDSIKLGEIELFDIEAYALKFPEESFSLGVIGLNVLRRFDIELLFSRSIIRLRQI
ncbi:MAG: retroviral-like aspartic protease family protein [Firmicutes bacterium]|nr:retroviral-like aspartic protease family protein [Bacillota bacterium]